MTREEGETTVTQIPRLLPRQRDGNKGTYGKVLVVAGSRGMSGAAILAGTAALRAGAGLVQVAVPDAIADIVASAQPCYMTAALPYDPNGRLRRQADREIDRLRKSADVVVIGPGLGLNDDIAEVVKDLVDSPGCPLLLDADALNAVASRPDLLARLAGPHGEIVMTPHPGEFARLIGSDPQTVQARRRELAVAFAREHGIVLVLKGAGTVVTDGHRVYVNATGNPGMATGGTGDVLSGILGALIAQGFANFDASVLGVYLHGLAGDIARDRVGEVSLIATDLIDHLPEAFRAISQES
jgi:ADP-dependent NAD(P)H-hydrate dehydratase